MKEAGGRIIVSPNTNPEVISGNRRGRNGLVPRVISPRREAFAAIDAGAHALKLFPAEAASPRVVKSQRAVLPKDVPLLVVGGVTPEPYAAWLDAGANGFGLGGGLYKPGQTGAGHAPRRLAPMWRR